MDRAQWKAAYGQGRKAAKGRDGLINVGVQYFSMTDQTGHGRIFYPSIIRDRSISSRVADALYWAKRYRQQARKMLRGVAAYRMDMAAARECIAEARDIRANASAFHAIP